MSQVEALASHWVLLFFLGLLNKYMLVWSIDYSSIDRSTIRQDYRSWSAWTPWSDCSRTCGGGVKMRTRVCNMRKIYSRSTVPNVCVGENVEYELCSVHNCSPFDKEFLDYQCSLKDGQSVGDRRIEEWISYRYGKNPCELQCWSKDRRIIHSFGKTIDGTKCATSDRRQSAVCINGRCMPVDCAGQIGNDNKLDRCGVCRGNNSTCIFFQDVFWRRPRVKTAPDGSKDHYEYEKICQIPAGATEIVVKENSENNFLAIMDHKGHYQLNGNWRIQSPGRLLIHGTEFIYNRTWDGGESLSASGPTRFDAFIHVLGSGDIPTVRHEYWISSNNPYKPARTLQTLNQVKLLDMEQKQLQPENNHIHDASAFTKKPAIPQAKFPGYKSYYHRNEILKSVPSWSIKRHQHANSHIHPLLPKSDVPETRGTDYVTENSGFAPPNRNVPVSSETKDDAKIRPKSNTSPRIHNSINIKAMPTSVPRNIPPSSANDFQKSSIPVSNHEKNDSRDKPGMNISPPKHKNSSVANTIINRNGGKPSNHRRKFNGKPRNVNNKARRRVYEQNVDEYGRPTTTLAQTRKIDNHRRTYVTLKPMYLEKDGDSLVKYDKDDPREHESRDGCDQCPKPKHQKKSFCTSDFVLRATVLSSEKQENSIRYEIDITRSYKNKMPISPREYVWTADSCRCPKLRTGKEYIVMGFTGTGGNKRESRLMVSKTSFVRKYSEKRARNMLRLVREQKTMCKKFE